MNTLNDKYLFIEKYGRGIGLRTKSLLILSLLSIMFLPILIHVHGQLANTPWPMFGHDLSHTGRSPYRGPQVGKLRWADPTNGWVTSSPVIGSDGTIYFGSYDYKLYATKPDRTTKWEYTTSGAIDSSPAIGVDGTVYVGSHDGNLYAIKPGGTLKWKYTTGGVHRSSPAVSPDGTIYFGSIDDHLYAISSNGVLKWRYTTGGPIQFSPAIGLDGTIYIGSSDYNLYAIKPDGTLRWRYFTYPYNPSSSVAIGSDGTIYLGLGDKYLYAINDGVTKWRFGTGDVVEAAPAIGSDGTIYANSCDGNFYAITPEGTLKWRYVAAESGLVRSSPAIDLDGTVYFGSSDTRLYAVKSDGTLKWSVDLGYKIHSSPAIGMDGVVYVGSYNQALNAIGAPLLQVAVSFTKSTYDRGQIVEIGGWVTNSTGSVVSDVSVYVLVSNPAGKTVYTATVRSDFNGKYFSQFTFPDDATLGTYTVYVIASKTGYDNGEAQATFTGIPEFQDAALAFMIFLLLAVSALNIKKMQHTPLPIPVTSKPSIF